VLVENAGDNPKTIKSIGDRDFDLVINLQYSRSPAQDRFIATIPTKFSMAVHAEGPSLKADALATANKLYSNLLHVGPMPEHELIRNFQILNAVTGATTAPDLPSITSLAEPAPFDLPTRYVAIFPGSTWFKKNYSWPRIVGLCRMLKSRFGLTSVLCGAASDQVIADNITRNAPHATLNLTGRLNLRQSFGVIADSLLLVTNDSMAGHAANLLGVRSICILSSGYNLSEGVDRKPVGRFFPYPEELIPTHLQTVLRYPMPCEGCGYHCHYDELVRDSLPCVDYIPLAAVMDAASTALCDGDLVRASRCSEDG
jgi:ADP-heptose:LPS heptosyltransferase